MALKGGSKYLNTTVPATGTPVTAVATTSIPMPNCSCGNEVIAAKSGAITMALSGAATSNTHRLFVLPANHIVIDAWGDVTTTAAAGKVELGVLGQACAAVDGGVALTLDAIAANSKFTQEIALSAAGLVRSTLSIPAVTTTAVTKNASVGVPVPYDRVIGLVTSTAITTNDAVAEFTMLYMAA